MVVQHPQRYATTLAGLSFAAYVSMFTWKFALLILGSLAFHELGHIWAMRKCGMKTKGIYFIPEKINLTPRSVRVRIVLCLMS